jgi:membrane-bound ClpP family serine protease
MDAFIWPLALILLGVLLLVLELFVPSGGALGIFAGIAFVAAVCVGYYENPYVGTSSLVAIAILLPVFFATFTHWWPKTPIGRRILLRRTPDEEAALNSDDLEQTLRLLVGKRGRAKTKMLPSGAVVIEGQTYDATTEGLAIDAGQPVEVIAQRLHRLVVRPVENDATPRPETPENLLAKPADEFGIDPFEDPLL